MANASMMPGLEFFQWSTPENPNPRLAAPLSESGTTIYVTTPPLDAEGKIVSKGFLMGIKSNGYTETVYVPAGEVDGAGNEPSTSHPGTTLTNVIRGIKLSGLDYTSGDADLAASHPQSSPVFCSVAAFHFTAMRDALQGTIASGGNEWKIGKEEDEDITIYAENGDEDAPFWRYDASENEWIFSNDGVSSTPFGTGAGVSGGDGIDVSAGVISVDEADTNKFVAVSSGASDAGKAVLFDTDGYVDQGSVQLIKDVTAEASELNKLDGVSENVSATNLNTLTGASDANALHYHKRTFGGGTKSVAGTSDTLNITHSLGTTPKWIKIKAAAVYLASASTPYGVSCSEGEFDGTSYNTLYWRSGGSAASADVTGYSNSKVVYLNFYNSSDKLIQATATLTSTQIQLTFTNSDSSAKSINYVWECGV